MLAPIRLQDVHSLLQQMIHSPADQVRLAAQVSELVRNLPPERGELLSRYQFDRPGLCSYVANWFNVEQDRDPGPEIVRIPHDAWIRGVTAFALVALDETQTETAGFLPAAQQRKAAIETSGVGARGLFDVSWRINSKQGFISSGASELEAPATLVTGDGQWAAALDWRLQQEDTIKVRVRNRIRRMFPALCVTTIDRTIPWICVTFWAEPLPQPRP